MAKTKRYFAQVVMNELQRNFKNADFKIREQEVWARMDQVVNKMARDSFFANWQFSGGTVDEQFITTWTDDNAITIVDQDDGKPSYLELPANYADLPRNGGIQEIWPMTYINGFQSVVIMSHKDARLYQNLKAGNMQGRLSGYPEGRRFYFRAANVGTDYSEKFGVRLVGINSSLIALDAIYPIPADKEQDVTDRLIAYFLAKQQAPLEVVRDGNNQSVEP